MIKNSKRTWEIIARRDRNTLTRHQIEQSCLWYPGMPVADDPTEDMLIAYLCLEEHS